MKPAQLIKEIYGSPARVLGDNLFPLRGKMLMKLNGDLLQIQTKLNWELEYQETDIRLSKITSISMTEGRMWWLLVIGFATAYPLFIGIFLIIAFFLLKQRWISISAGSERVVLIFSEKESKNVKLFRQTVLAAARQSGVPTPPRTPRPPASTAPPSGSLRDSQKLDPNINA